MVAKDISAKVELELRRGVLVLAILSQLSTPRYGYELRQELAAKGMSIEEGTLYPMLRRLEKQGLLDSDWRTGEGAPRRYYVLKTAGRTLLERLTESWQDLNQSVARLLNSGGE